jgi:hypothetical protein
MYYDVNLQGVAYGNGRFVAVGYSSGAGGRAVYTSDGGATWGSAYPSGLITLYDIAFGNGKFMATGTGTIFETSTCWVGLSTDGNTWTPTAVPAGCYNLFGGIAYGNGTFVVAGVILSTPYIWYSTDDGASWTAATITTTIGNMYFSGVAYGGGQFVAVGNNTSTGYPQAAYSTNGASWSTSSMGPSSSSYVLEDVTYGNGRFVAVGVVTSNFTGATWWSGNGGATWNAVNVGGRRLSGVGFGNSRFVAVGELGTILWSTNGESWTSASSSGGWLHDVAYGP